MTRFNLAFATLAIICVSSVSSLTHGQQSDPVTGLAITEILWKSSHPTSDAETGLGGNANGDWYELTNFGSEPINLGGFLMDDDDQLFGDDYAILPEIVIQPNESIIFAREDDARRPGGFLDAWGLPENFRVLGECTSLGNDTFSGLSSGGDELNIYPPNAVDDAGAPAIVDGDIVPPIVSVSFPSIGDNGGQSFMWDADGNLLGFSQGLEGAYSAIDDGSERDPLPADAPLDVASPGYVTGLDPSVAAGTQPTLTRLFPDEPHFSCPVEPGEPSGCDLDGDGVCDINDLDALYAANGESDPLPDLDGSGTVDADDIDDWLAAASDAEATTFRFGDIDLNGDVDSTDLGLLLNNFGDQSGVGWSGGDLNLNDVVDSTDLGLLLNEFGQTSASAAAVPEPGSLALLLVALAGIAHTTRKK